MTWHGVTFRKTHSLKELAGACERIDPTLTPGSDKVVSLTQDAQKSGYPGEPREPSGEQAAEAVAIAREMFDAVVTRLPEEVRA